MNTPELVAYAYLACGVAAIVMPSGKRRPKPFDPFWLLAAIGFGPIALFIAWDTRRQNIEEEEAKRQVKKEWGG